MLLCRRTDFWNASIRCRLISEAIAKIQERAGSGDHDAVKVKKDPQKSKLYAASSRSDQNVPGHRTAKGGTLVRFRFLRIFLVFSPVEAVLNSVAAILCHRGVVASSSSRPQQQQFVPIFTD